MISIEILDYSYLIPRIKSITKPTWQSLEKVKFDFLCTWIFFFFSTPFFFPRLSLKGIPSSIPDVTVDGKELFTTMMSETARLDPHILLAIRKLKGNTNAFNSLL